MSISKKMTDENMKKLNDGYRETLRENSSPTPEQKPSTAAQAAFNAWWKDNANGLGFHIGAQQAWALFRDGRHARGTESETASPYEIRNDCPKHPGLHCSCPQSAAASLCDALRDCLALIGRHSWTSRDQPIIERARLVLERSPSATGSIKP